MIKIGEICTININGIDREIYKGNLGAPFYYLENKEVYLSIEQKRRLDNYLNFKN